MIVILASQVRTATQDSVSPSHHVQGKLNSIRRHQIRTRRSNRLVLGEATYQDLLDQPINTDASERFQSAQRQRERQPILADAVLAPARTGQAPAFTSLATLHINLERTIHLHTIT